MYLNFDTNRIMQLMMDFNKLTGLRISFWDVDLNERFKYPLHGSKFCDRLKEDKKAFDKCNECDRTGCKKAEETGKLYIYKCHIGLYEAVISVVEEKKLIGWMMIGQILFDSADTNQWEIVGKNCSQYSVNLEESKKLFMQIPHISSDKLEAAIRLMEMSSKYIYLSNMVKISHPSIVNRLVSYVKANISSSLTLIQISDFIGISKSYVNRIANEELGMSIFKYIKRERIYLSKKLLIESDMPISLIAETIGMPSANYFSRLFKKEEGISPTEFRNKNI